MVGSWAGAMGHTQWMPEVWLHVGIDYDGDGKISPFGAPDDALGSTARYLVERGQYRRGEHWGFEVRMPAGASAPRRAQLCGLADARRCTRRRQPYPQPNATARPWVPVPGGPAFLLGANFFAVKSYNPSMNYALALVHLGDRCVGGAPFVQKFPGSERAPTLGRSGGNSAPPHRARLRHRRRRRPHRQRHHARGANYQRKIGMEPADGYAGVGLLARLRQGS